MQKIIGEKESQVEAKKSRFLGFCFYVESVDKVKEILDSFEGKYKGSVHTVYAYRLKENGVLREKFDNDREPVGSAGPPLLSLLKNKGVMNCLLVVVRYFGGTLLGTGGLVRAYTSAGQLTLEENLCLLEQNKEK
ncbi:YigZ family protein [Patescibacteria group bacterium]|nr:YigZ family protein [Patescibacteria group bacterium]